MLVQSGRRTAKGIPSLPNLKNELVRCVRLRQAEVWQEVMCTKPTCINTLWIPDNLPQLNGP